LKSLILNLHVDSGPAISKLVLVHPNTPEFCCLGGLGLVDGNPIANDDRRFTAPSHTLQAPQLCILD
jgi:hypothetical protein